MKKLVIELKNLLIVKLKVLLNHLSNNNNSNYETQILSKINLLVIINMIDLTINSIIIAKHLWIIKNTSHCNKK